LAEGRGEITESSLEALKVGSDSRKDILLRYGEPSWQNDDQTHFIYEWAEQEGELVFLIPLLDGYVIPAGTRYSVSVTFDQSGILTNKRRCGNCNENLYPPGINSADLTSLYEVPEGKSAIFLYRDLAAIDTLLPLPVSLDQSHLARLKFREYAYMTLEPGKHEIFIPSTLVHESSEESVPMNGHEISLSEGEIGFVELKVKMGIFSAVESIRVTIKEKVEEDFLVDLPNNRRVGFIKQ
jgi:hypothetical protein